MKVWYIILTVVTTHMIQRSISMKKHLWMEIDKQRGDIPRSRFIARILADSLENLAKNRGKDGSQ